MSTARLFVPFHIEHPVWMLAFLVLTSVTFSLFGFIIGLWASGWEKLQIVPILIITPLAFLGGSFYSIGMVSVTSSPKMVSSRRVYTPARSASARARL